MRLIAILIALAAIIGLAAIYFGFLDVRQTRTATLPSVEVKAGQLPTFNASVAKVEVGSRNETVEVPTVAVKKP